MRIKKQEERWFEIPGDEDKAQILIKHLNPGEIADIMDGVFKQTIVYKTDGDGDAQPEFTQSTDKKKDREQTLTSSVKDWKKFYDQAGKVLKCTPKNIIRASREIEGFDDLVTEFRRRLAADIAQEQAEETKDLEKN